MVKAFLRRLPAILSSIGTDANDSDEVRLQKKLLVVTSSMVIPAAIIWGVIYLVFKEPLAASIPLSYSVVSTLSIVIFGLTRRYHLFRISQLWLILLLPFLLHVSLGGFVNSSGVVLWALLCPFGALVFGEPRRAPLWLLAYLGLVIGSSLLQPSVVVDNNLSPVLVLLFFVANIGTVSSIAYILLYYFISQRNLAFRLLHREQEKSESLLLNVLPAEIATILKNKKGTIADQHDAVSILFADIVGFTPLSIKMSPIEMVDLLNEVFSHFDTMVEKYDLEKIRTIGDNYMVVSGAPRSRPDHAQALARMALDMRDCINDLNSAGRPLNFRIGMNSGPVIAGVIGHKKFHYDVWGDAVNTASRMESHGVPGKIQITRETYELLKDEFDCEPRGKVDVKGKGEMETWYLEGSEQVASVSY